MKKIFLTLITFFLLLSLTQAQTIFKKTLETNGEIYANYARKIIDGGYIINGEIKDSVTNCFDIMLLKTDSLGNIEWSKKYISQSFELSNHLAITNDKGYLIFGTNYTGHSGIRLIKTDSIGNFQWCKNIAETLEYSVRAYNVIDCSDKGFLILGASTNVEFSSPPPTNAYDISYFLKVDSIGNVKWAHKYDNGDVEGIRSGIETLDKKYLTIGDTKGFGRSQSSLQLNKIDTNGNLIFTKLFSFSQNILGNFIYQNPDSSYIVCGSTNNELVLMKLEKDFSLAWIKSYQSFCRTVRDLIYTSDKGYFLIGNLGISPIAVMKIDSLGEVEWYKKLSNNIFLNPNAGMTTIKSWELSDSIFQIIAPIKLNNTNKILFERISRNNTCEPLLPLTEYSYPIPSVGYFYPVPIIIQTYTSFISNSIINFSFTDSLLCLDSALFVEKFSQYHINIFPNPATNYIKINIPEKATIEIINIEGQIIKKINYNSKEATIDLDDLPSGYYILKVITVKEILTKKFIKE